MHPRRRFLAAAAGAGVGAALAGCLGLGDGGDAPALQEHAAGSNLADQPRRGPDPTAAEAVVVAFEDPSCSRCRTFERETVPKIQSELVEPGRGAFVFRGYPVVYPWGDPASHALEATFARDETAHWALVDHYFAEQDAFDEANVLDRTQSFLDAETDVDGSAVVADVEGGTADAAVQTDLDAGEAAEAGRTTPTVFLFRDGEYRTKAAGSVSFDVIANALEL
jgi:protein-disulfide isomerase